MGLLAVADEYGGTAPATLAHFYAADALYRLGEYEEALEHFQAFDGDDAYLEASALAGEAAVHENLEDFARAGQLYEEAAERFESELTTPRFLFGAGRAYEAAGDYAAAEAAYEALKEGFPDAPAAQNVDAYLARVAALQGV